MPYGTLNADTITNSNGLSGNAIGPGFKNRIINGDMRIDQRNAGASVTPTGNTYTIDRWFAGMSQASKFSVQRSTTAPTGFINSALITSTSAYSVTSTDRFAFSQFIEGLNCTDLGWGTASAKTMTLSFQVRSSLTGTFGGAFQNNASDRSYPFTYTISAANTWETKTVTVAGDTTGTWLTNNEIGIQVRFDLGTGSTYSNTAGAWVAGDYRSATGAVSLVGTSGATLYITGVQFEVAPSATSFDYRDYGRELIMCYRYYYLHASFAETNFGVIGVGYNYTASQMNAIVYFPVTMRIAPTLTATSGTDYYLFERNGGDDFLNSLTISGATPKASGVNNSSQISGTAGQAGRLLTYTSGASVAFNAEL